MGGPRWVSVLVDNSEPMATPRLARQGFPELGLGSNSLQRVPRPSKCGAGAHCYSTRVSLRQCQLVTTIGVQLSVTLKLDRNRYSVAVIFEYRVDNTHSAAVIVGCRNNRHPRPRSN